MPRTIRLYDVLITVVVVVFWHPNGLPHWVAHGHEAELASLGSLSKVIRV